METTNENRENLGILQSLFVYFLGKPDSIPIGVCQALIEAQGTAILGQIETVRSHECDRFAKYFYLHKYSQCHDG